MSDDKPQTTHVTGVTVKITSNPKPEPGTPPKEK